MLAPHTPRRRGKPRGPHSGGVMTARRRRGCIRSRSMKTLLTVLLTLSTPGWADDRAADRAAIRAHIDRIFQAFIHQDAAELRATHARNWLGYLEGSRTMIRGVDGYMDHSGHFDPTGAYRDRKSTRLNSSHIPL